jgi:DNA-binding CsgD family transcriptional regulator
VFILSPHVDTIPDLAGDAAAAIVVERLIASTHRIAHGPITAEESVVFAGVAQLLPGVFGGAYDRDGRYLWLSDSLSTMVGVRSQELLGRSITEFFEPRWCRERLDIISRVLHSERMLTTVEIFHGRRVEGAVLPLIGSSAAIYLGRFALVCSPRVGGAVVPDPHPPELLEEADWGPLAALTRRELEVLRLVACGLDNTEIAQRIHRSKRAVEWHIKNLYTYLHCNKRTDLFRMGLLAGLPDIDDSHWDRMIARVRQEPEADPAKKRHARVGGMTRAAGTA